MAHYNVPRGVRISFYRGHKPLSTLPRPRKSLHSWLSPRPVPGQQAGGNVCWHNFFSVAGLWCDVVSYNGSHVYVFCSSGFWKKTFTRPVQKTNLGSLSCLGYSSHVSFSNRFNLHHWLAPVVLCLNHFLLPPITSRCPLYLVQMEGSCAEQYQRPSFYNR